MYFADVLSAFRIFSVGILGAGKASRDRLREPLDRSCVSDLVNAAANQGAQ